MCIISKGITALCENDSEFNSLIAPRSKDVISLLLRYVNEIETFNPAYGLVGSNNTEELIIKHILDSLAPVGIITRLFADSVSGTINGEKAIQIADVGSGAGLPGIPLAIAMPKCEFTLIERMGRRAGFLYNTKAVLSLSNVTVEENEIEKIAGKQGINENFNLITFRAFKPLEPKLLKTLLKISTPQGIIAAYKGKKEKIEAEMITLGMPENEWKTVSYTVPFLDEQRHLLLIQNKPKNL